MSKGPKHNLFNIAQLLVVLSVGAYGIWGSFVLFMSSFGIDTPVKYIEVIGSLFAAVAVCVALLSLYFQQRNFQTQLAELKGDSLSNTFSMLIEIHEKITSNLKYEGKNGRNCFSYILNDFHATKFYAELFSEGNQYSKLKDNFKHNVLPSYGNIFEYVNTTSSIFDIIEAQQSVDEEKKGILLSIFKSRLAEAELSFLMYHSMFADTNDNLRSIANKYHLYETIKEESKSPAVQEYFEPSAFGLPAWDKPSPDD